MIVAGGLAGLTPGIALKLSGADRMVGDKAPEIRAAGASIGFWKNVGFSHWMLNSL